MNVTETEADERPTRSFQRELYWTACVDCGSYISMPDAAEKVGATVYRCCTCR